MRRKGFIAISLLYSFFLVFITIMMTLLVTYAHNRLLMNSVNNNVKNQLTLYSAQTPDRSGAISPKLTNNMIPIYFDYTQGDGVWRKADVNNDSGQYQWYNYEELMWANVAVMRTTALYNTYNSKPVGEIINQADVSAYFVWIPRFRYLIFNAEVINAYSNQRIRINFENNDQIYSQAVKNNNYTTHPAFLLPVFNVVGNRVYQEYIDGFWVGKYETTGTQSDITIKNGLNALKLNYANQYTAGNNFKSQKSLNFDTRMMKNTEWGAVAYLTQSKYGMKGNPEYFGLREVGNNPTLYTGGSNEAYGFAKNSNLIQSTTGNVYGVYDMAGGNVERMLNYFDASGTKYPSSPAVPSDKAYYDLYTAGNAIHGDATLETNQWISLINTFVTSGSPTFIRGSGNLFRYQAANHTVTHAFRIVIPMKGAQ